MPETDPSRIYVPVRKAFENNNTFTGSAGRLRFRLSPVLDTQQIRAEIWYGEYCYEKSEIVGEQLFPLSDEGRMVLRDYLEELRDAAN